MVLRERRTIMNALKYKTRRMQMRCSCELSFARNIRHLGAWCIPLTCGNDHQEVCETIDYHLTDASYYLLLARNQSCIRTMILVDTVIVNVYDSFS